MDQPRSRRERRLREEGSGDPAPAPQSTTSPRPVIRSAPRSGSPRYQQVEHPGQAPTPGHAAGATAAGAAAAQHGTGTAAQRDPGSTISAQDLWQRSEPTAVLPAAAVGGGIGGVGGNGAGGNGPGGPHNPPGHGTGSGGRGNSGNRRGKRQPKEYEPLGPVRGTIRAFGELCITAGLVLILFVVWQLWWTDIAANQDNEELTNKLVQEWQQNPNELPKDPKTPVVAKAPEHEKAFGIVYIPRFGDNYYRTLAEGVSLEPVLNRMGLGHYPTSAMPGEVGNFALAGHRVTYGKPLNLIAEMRPGDEIIVQTADGFYTYTFRNFDIVLPNDTDVLAPVPAMPDYKGKDRIMTMTACNPMFSARERYIAYAELTDWRPSHDGPPEAIKDSKAYQKSGGA